jgi:hypothetical protein
MGRRDATRLDFGMLSSRFVEKMPVWDLLQTPAAAAGNAALAVRHDLHVGHSIA